MAAALLTVAEAAKYEGCSEKGLYTRIYRGKIAAVKKRSAGRDSWYIPESELSEIARKKYYKSGPPEHPEEPEKAQRKTAEPKTLEELTEGQRRKAAEWEEILQQYHDRIGISGAWKQKKKITELFVEEWNSRNKKQISVRTLERKEALYKQYGLAGLADNRVESGRKAAIDDKGEAWSLFLQYWLDEARPAVSTCYSLVQGVCEMYYPELLPLPSEHAFYRKTKEIEYDVVQYFRYGKKAFEDKCLPWLRRMYDDIESNDVWSSDYHTLDVFVRDDVTGKVFRPHAAVWIDIRSRKVLSVVLAENSNSDGVILAFRKAVSNCGLPDKVYLDNGREFLVHDFGGRGKRKTDPNADYGLTILERCGVEMHNATVKNAKAKIIERIFRDVKNDFSKLCTTFCGGRPEERPERLDSKFLGDARKVPLLSEVRRRLELYFEGIHNEHASKAMGMGGKCPNEVYQEHLVRKRVATEDQLNLMLLRTTRLQQVGRNGVQLKFGEIVLDYYNEELVHIWQKQKVYVRYDIEHLGSVRVYDNQDRYICKGVLKQTGGYALGEDTNLDAIKEVNRQKKERRQSVIRKMEDCVSRIQAPDAAEMVEKIALQNLEKAARTYETQIIEVADFRSRMEEPEEEVEIDLSRMVKNAAEK